MVKQQKFKIPIGFDMYFFLSITTKQFVLLTDLKSRRCSSTSLRLLRSEKPETGVDRILLDAESSCISLSNRSDTNCWDCEIPCPTLYYPISTILSTLGLRQARMVLLLVSIPKGLVLLKLDFSLYIRLSFV
ncbi:hypothetical protein BRARA_B01752 [Brassica rapa]|uniref:Uncharacterized protein n=1 Tax=Brassica campestris TaxID=3711 RepID=A0A398AB12_BRACM|nr:hypothetical protein BRARA_B01752 [Brassica rapa]